MTYFIHVFSNLFNVNKGTMVERLQWHNWMGTGLAIKTALVGLLVGAGLHNDSGKAVHILCPYN